MLKNRNPYKVLPGIIVDNISDHMPTFMIRTSLFRACQSNSSLTIKYRNINENSLRCIYNQINSLDLLILAESNDCTMGLTELLRIIQQPTNITVLFVLKLGRINLYKTMDYSRNNLKHKKETCAAYIVSRKQNPERLFCTIPKLCY